MTTTSRFLVPAMDCATEKDIIANRLGRVDDVEHLEFDLLDRIVTVRHRPGADARVEAALREIGMKPKRGAGAALHRPDARMEAQMPGTGWRT